MVEESVGPKTDLIAQDKKDTKTQDKKSDGTTKNKVAKQEKSKDGTPTPEGQKRVTKKYRSGWKRIWGSKK